MGSMSEDKFYTMPIPSLHLRTKLMKRNKVTNVHVRVTDTQPVKVQMKKPLENMERIRKRKKKNPNKLTPLNHGGGIFFFMQKFVESPSCDDDLKSYKSESTATTTTDDMINCDLVLKYKPIESPIESDEGLTTETTTQTSSNYTSFSDVYGFGNNEVEKNKRLKLRLTNKDSNIFKPDQLGICRSDNNVYRDFVIADKEKRDWWISDEYYDENSSHIQTISEPDKCMVI